MSRKFRMKSRGILKHSLLGFLMDGPASGYDLVKVFHYDYRPAVTLIYRVLKKMADEGLVDFERVDQPKAQYKNVFSITGRGISELQKWISEPQIPEPTRDPIFLQLWFGNNGTKKDTLKLLKRYISNCRKQQKHYLISAQKSPGRKSNNQNTATLYRRLVGECIMQNREQLINWAENAIKVISDFEDADTKRRGSGTKWTTTKSKKLIRKRTAG